MDEERKTPKTEEKPKKKGNERNSVVIVQTLACAFLIFLVAATNKLSPESFEFLREEYNRLMAVDMSANEVVSSAVSAAQSVMSVQASAAEPEETEQKEEEEKTEKSVAVIAELGMDKKITVPVHGRVSSEYGYRTNPISGAYALHTGVDIATDEGTDIVAAYSGVVKDTGTGTKRGKYVLMKHPDGSETLYCHCSKILVEEDDVIKAGEVVALVGSTGWATGPHLHFEIRRDGNSINPLDVLEEKNGRV